MTVGARGILPTSQGNSQAALDSIGPMLPDLDFSSNKEVVLVRPDVEAKVLLEAPAPSHQLEQCPLAAPVVWALP